VIVAASVFFGLARFPVKVFASTDFLIDFRSRYDVSREGVTRVRHEVTVTNETANAFISEYALSIGSTNVAGIVAFDQTSTLPVSRRMTERSTLITVDLEPRPAIGAGRAKQFSIEYENNDIATVVGKVLEVNIPKIADAREFRSYEVTLVVPDRYGKPTSVLPPASTVLDRDRYVLTFRGVTETGISALFGTRQQFSVTLTYTLDNANGSRSRQRIALPPDTAYQRVRYAEIDPLPRTTERDRDGNWLAWYDIPDGERVTIQAAATVETFMEPTIPVPNGDPSLYLAPTELWPRTPEIQKLADELKTPEAMYRFVSTHLNYDYDRAGKPVERLGADGALRSPDRAICTEFTDLFIALARAAGIPARELNGFAYTENPKLRPLSLSKDILHAWPEYWDDRGETWKPVDPTWENTTGGIDYFSKLDFNHIVFVIHGTSPTEPWPAGFYKTDESQGKTVAVVTTSDVIGAPLPLEVALYKPDRIPTFVSTTMKIEVRNPSLTARYHVPISIRHSFRPMNKVPPSLPVVSSSRRLFGRRRNRVSSLLLVIKQRSMIQKRLRRLLGSRPSRLFRFSQRLRSRLPSSAGVYAFRDVRNHVLYIGKAKSLDSRVSSYLRRPHALPAKTRLMVSQANSVLLIMTGSELEAIFLEARMIRDLKPTYNARLRDDASKLYIAITDCELPTVVLKRRGDILPGDFAVGPFLSSRQAGRIVRHVRTILPFCSKRRRNGRPCFYAHLGLCPGVCSGVMTRTAYRRRISDIRRLLSGDVERLRRRLARDMRRASQQQNYELAATYRDIDTALDGALSASLLENDLDRQDGIEQLSALATLLQRVGIHLPVSSTTRIEAYDVSNLGRQSVAGSLVVFTGGIPDTAEYRTFRMRDIETSDDPRVMADLIARRLLHPEWPKPDLVLIDGGEPQLRAIQAACPSPTGIPRLPRDIPFLGLAKGHEDIVVPTEQSFRRLGPTFPIGPAWLLLMALRDEAHRCAQRYHHALQSRAFMGYNGRQ
jgi:excinuclease ABC subunit C